jgi:DNA-binding transcriptional MerR regulator
MSEPSAEFGTQLMTIGELAERLDVSTHRIKYAIDQYRIKPTRRVGIIRVWSENAIPQIENALDCISRKRSRKSV